MTVRKSPLVHILSDEWYVLTALFTKPPAPYSAIHNAAGSLVTGHSLQNRKMSMGNHHTEWSPEVVLYGSRLYGSFVNSAVSYQPFPAEW